MTKRQRAENLYDDLIDVIDAGVAARVIRSAGVRIFDKSSVHVRIGHELLSGGVIWTAGRWVASGQRAAVKRGHVIDIIEREMRY